GIAARVLLNLGVKLEEVREEILEFLGADTRYNGASEGGEEAGGGGGGSGGGGEPAGAGAPSDAGGGTTAPRGKSQTPALNAFGRDLTTLAREGKLDPVIGRRREIERVMQILCRRTKNNPVLLGEAGVGKTAIVEGLAQDIVSGNVPEILADKRIVVLDLAMMVAGTKYRGQFQERIQAVMNA